MDPELPRRLVQRKEVSLVPMATEEHQRRDLVVSREPVGPVKKNSQKTDGEQTLNDAMLLIIAAWVFLLLLAFSLRGHIV